MYLEARCFPVWSLVLLPQLLLSITKLLIGELCAQYLYPGTSGSEFGEREQILYLAIRML